uniref:MmyB-like transcription regulator ligand binding domain-containing protein n=1 Tax=Cystobacter fuscus TaxID=43 RepID=A0A3Q8I2Z9_9BACT|nr:hypothetical protein [Cystobacter fuscus]AYM53262.1 hypothetical protein [Cystobacter fuscus]
MRPGIQQLLAQTPALPVLVHDVTYDALAWNEMAATLLVDFAAWEPPERSLLWLARAGVRHSGVRPPRSSWTRRSPTCA